MVVDDFIDRVMADARLNANPAVNEAHHKVPPAGFKYLVAEMVGWATGGSETQTQALGYAHPSLQTLDGSGSLPSSFGYAHEALARAYVLFGDSREARLHLKLAAGSEICVDRSPGWSASLLRNGD